MQTYVTNDELFYAIASADLPGVVRELDRARPPRHGPGRRVCLLEHTVHSASFDSPITAAVSARGVGEDACVAMLCELLRPRNAHVAGYIDFQGDAGDTPLGLAIRRGWSHVVVQLLMHRADPNHVSTRHHEPLLVTAVASQSRVILHAMLDSIVDRSGGRCDALVGLREDSRGMNALATACAMGWLEGVHLLLEHGASATDVCGIGSSCAELTALHCTPHTRAADIFAALISAGGIALTSADCTSGPPRSLHTLVLHSGNRELVEFFGEFLEWRECLAHHAALACAEHARPEHQEAQLQMLALAKMSGQTLSPARGW